MTTSTMIRIGRWWTVLGLLGASLAAASPLASPDPRREAEVANLRRAWDDCTALVTEKTCAPIIVRLAWHEAGTYDAKLKNGGAIGTIIYPSELAHPNDAGLDGAVELLRPLHERNPGVSWSDLIQMCSAAAIEASGGPRIPMRYGRVDDPRGPDAVPPVNRLPDGAPPFHRSKGRCPWRISGDPSPADHLRRVFHRMGLSDQEIVALSGAHTLGRAYKQRSGLPSMNETVYTEHGPGTRGGMSWTKDWLAFDNAYYVELKEAKEAGEGANHELLRLATDTVLFTDAVFKEYAEVYARDQEAFFADYALAHAKLSERGAHFHPPGGIIIDTAEAAPASYTSPLYT